MTGHLEIVLGGLAALFVVIVLVDRFVFQRYMTRIVARLPEADRAAFKTRYRLLRRAVEAVIVFIGLLAILFSFDQTRSAAQTVLASSALLGVVVGFAARSTLANFVAGVMIAVNQPIRLGDRVVIADVEGIVEDVGLTYTRLRTPDNRRVLIPNEELASSRVANMTADRPGQPGPGPGDGSGHRRRDARARGAVRARGRRARGAPRPARARRERRRADGTGAVFTVGVWTADATQAVQTAAWLRERALARLNDEGVLAALEPEAAG